MTETTKWVIQLSAAIICVAIVYQYISFKIEFKQKLKDWQRTQDEIAINKVRHSNNESRLKVNTFEELLNAIYRLNDYGFTVGVDASLLAKYPQLTEFLAYDQIIIIKDVAQYARTINNVVGIQNFRESVSAQRDSMIVKEANPSYLNQIGLNPDDITDRAIGSYLYTEKTNLINVMFLTFDQGSMERANLVGLRSTLI